MLGEFVIKTTLVKRIFCAMLAAMMLTGITGCGDTADETTAETTAQTEALSAQSWKTVMPTFYDVAMAGKGVRDEDSAEMLDIIFDNRYIDFAYLYDGWKGWVFSLRTMIQSNNFASTYASKEKSMYDYYGKVLAFFLEEQE